MKTRLLNIVAFIASGFHSPFTLGQEIEPLGAVHNLSPNSIDIGVMRGFLVAHHGAMQNLYHPIQGIQIHYLRDMRRNALHPNMFKGVKGGYTLTYQDLGSAAAGKAIGMGFSLYVKHLKSTSFTVGMGGGYLTSPYNSDNNPGNIAIGSHINGMMRLGYRVEPKLGANSSVFFEVGMTHFSNANWSQPNLGVNMPYLSLGTRIPIYLAERFMHGNTHFSDQIKRHQKSLRQLNDARYSSTMSVDFLKKKWNVMGGISVGRRQIELDQEKNFSILVFEALLERTASLGDLQQKKKHFSSQPQLGLMVFRDRTYQYVKPNPLPPYSFSATTEVAAVFGNRFLLGRFGVVTDFGLYLYRPNVTKRRYFEVLGLSYQVSPRCILSTRLKAHLSSADFIHWGASYFF